VSIGIVKYFQMEYSIIGGLPRTMKIMQEVLCF